MFALCFSFPGSAWERTAPEALPRFSMLAKHVCLTSRQAEPASQWVPRQSLGTSWWRSARSVLMFDLFELWDFRIFGFFFAGHRVVDDGREAVQLTPYLKS